MTGRTVLYVSFWIVIMTLFLHPAAVQADYVTIVQATADSWVNRDLPDQSYPTSSTLWMRGPIPNTAGDDKEAFVEFEVPDVAIDTVVVRLMGAGYGSTNPNQLEISIVPVAVDVNSLTWNTRPTYGTVLATASVWNGLTEVMLPAGSFPTGQTVVLRLRLNLEGWGYFQSLESGGMIPELRIVTPEFSDVTTSALQDVGGSASGFAWGDYDNDGDDDVYIANESGGHKLVRNDGGGVFADVTPPVLTDAYSGRGATWVDYDNDGDLDLFRAGVPNKLFNNEGGGVFVDSTSSFQGGGGNSLSNAWADFDGDGDLDVFSSQYAESNYFRNDGDVFANATTGPLVISGGHANNTADYDNDGDQDLFVGADLSTLLRNDGGGVFVDVSVAPLQCCDNWGLCWGDYDNDGDMDICQSGSHGTILFRNDGSDTWTRAETSAMLAAIAQGAAWGDYDNDGDLDLYTVLDVNYLFRNDGGGTFTDVTSALLQAANWSRACDWVDYDDDGDLDIFFIDAYGDHKLLRNNLVSDHHWLQVDLVGSISNLSGVGSRIRVVSGGLSQIREVTIGTSARSQGGLTAAFGLGTSSVADTVEVGWPSGIVSQLFDVAADQLITIGEVGVEVAVTTDPPGRDVDVDGQTYTAPHGFASGLGASHALAVTSPQVNGDTTFVFSGWSDGGAISHTIAPTTDTTYTAYFDLLYTYALIDSVVDVPDDQGGWVRVHFLRSVYDDVDETTNPIAMYAVHRRVDNPALVAEILDTGKRSGDGTVLTCTDGREFRIVEGPDASAPPGVWEVVGTVPARQQDHYIFLAPTVADSAETPAYSVYFIAAHTTTPSVYFDSPPDSGYSVDNIAPAVPPAFMATYNTGSGNTLTWDPVPDNDLQYYRIYRGTEVDFETSPENLIDQTTSTTWSDPEYDGWQVYYKVCAVDDAGNVGEAAGWDPASGINEQPAVPVRFALRQNVPNPFNPVTVIQYDVPAGGGHVLLLVYDVAGRHVRTLVDEAQAPGVKTVLWNGRNDRGAVVASGVYFCRLTAPGFDQTRKMLLMK